MIKAVNECYSYEYANIHRGIYELSSKLTKRYEDSSLSYSGLNKHEKDKNVGLFDTSVSIKEFEILQ